MRKCAWLSAGEMRQLVLVKVVRGQGPGMHGPFFSERVDQNGGPLIGADPPRARPPAKSPDLLRPDRKEFSGDRREQHYARAEVIKQPAARRRNAWWPLEVKRGELPSQHATASIVG